MSEQTFVQKAEGLARVTECLLGEKATYKEAAVKTVDNLVELGSIKAEDREKVAASLSGDTGKALSIIENLAKANQAQAVKLSEQAEVKQAEVKVVEKDAGTIGAPDTTSTEKKASDSKNESDKIWERTFSV